MQSPVLFGFNVGMTLFVAALFVLLTPGIVLCVPTKGPLLHKAIVHGLLFAIVYHYTHRIVWKMVTEGFQAAKPVVPVKPAKV